MLDIVINVHRSLCDPADSDCRGNLGENNLKASKISLRARLAATVGIAVCAPLLVTAPTSATDEMPVEQPLVAETGIIEGPVISRAETIGVPTVTEEFFLNDDAVEPTWTKVHSAATSGQTLGTNTPEPSTMGNDSGSGGNTSASGCRRVTLSNHRYTLLRSLAYTYVTWTRWCWTRSSQNIYGVSTGWDYVPDDPNFYWQKNINKETIFYDYSTNDGHPRSAYKHFRRGMVENCIAKYGCIGVAYPENLIRSYYNGTWVWTTEDG